MSKEKKETRVSFKKNSFNIEEFIEIDDKEKQIKKDKNGNFIYKDNFGNVKLATIDSKPNIKYQSEYLLNTNIENGELKANVDLNKNKLENILSSEEKLLEISKKMNQYNYKSVINNIKEFNEIMCSHCGTISNNSENFCFNCGNIFVNEAKRSSCEIETIGE